MSVHYGRVNAALAMISLGAVGLLAGLNIQSRGSEPAEPIAPQRVYLLCENSIILPAEHIGPGLSMSTFVGDCEIHQPEDLEAIHHDSVLRF